MARESLEASRVEFEQYLDSANTETLMSCMLSKMQIAFENYEDVDQNSEEVQELTQQCLQEIIDAGGTIKPRGNPNSKRGDWASEDIAALVNELEKMRSDLEGILSPGEIDELLVCIVQKAQHHYDNYVSAFQDTTNIMTQFMYECMQSQQIFDDQKDPFDTEKKEIPIPDPNSQKGQWSESDRKLLREALSEMQKELINAYGEEKTTFILECVARKFETTFENYAVINNHPELYKKILDSCFGLNNQN
jgi:hypothetical protein